MSIYQTVARFWLTDLQGFSRLVIRKPLYGYQLAPARAIVDSVLNRRGLEFAVMFPRQSGKNETQSHVEAYLLNLFQRIGDAAIVKAQPTFKPQAENAMDRLEKALNNEWNEKLWWSASDNRLGLGQAQVIFFSAHSSASVVGASATLLLECDEAQDVLEAEWDKKFVPMGASANATIVHWGTAWTSRTLLAKTIRRLREQEGRDGRQRVFVVTPERVAEENPAYGAFVERQVARNGRNHPLVKTQYFNEEIDAEGGMFPPARRALMQGSHPPQAWPKPGRVYAFLLDIAGEDEFARSNSGATGLLGPSLDGLADSAGGGLDDLRGLKNPRRDSTALTIVEVDLATLTDPALQAPTYRVRQRQAWVGTPHTQLYGQIRALAHQWNVSYLVADSTGVGAGLVSFLGRALPTGTVIPYEFSSASKSKLGWGFLAVCDTGRWQEWKLEVGGEGSEAGPESSDVRPLTSDLQATAQATFFQQLEFCQYKVRPGPGQLLTWGVPDGSRDPATGELVHDDFLLSAALCAELDDKVWHVDTGPTHIIRAADPLDEMSRGF